MDSSARFTALAWLLVRIALAMMLIGAAIALFQGSTAPKGTAKPWIGPDAPPIIPAVAYAVVLIGAGLIIAAGWQLPLGLFATCALFLVVTVERLVRNPFTNLTADIGIMLAFALALLAAGPERDRWRLGARGDAPTAVSRDRWSWISLFVRLFIGGIFFSQGFRNLFLGKGVMVFRRTPLRDTLPRHDARAAAVDHGREQSVRAVRRRSAPHRGAVHALGGNGRRALPPQHHLRPPDGRRAHRSQQDARCRDRELHRDGRADAAAIARQPLEPRRAPVRKNKDTAGAA
jgi:hypothetical protein